MKKNLEDSEEIVEAPTIFGESVYLITSNRERCADLLKKHSLSEDDMVDVYISLHIVLEAGLNSLFRYISLSQIKNPKSRIEAIKHLDRISFIDKATLFIYSSSFDFGDNFEKALEYRKIIDELIRFSEVRNKLLHGHSISAIFDLSRKEVQQSSEAKKLLDEKKLKVQIELFRHIMEGLRFYVDHLITLDKDKWVKPLVTFFLRDDFLSKYVADRS